MGLRQVPDLTGLPGGPLFGLRHVDENEPVCLGLLAPAAGMDGDGGTCSAAIAQAVGEAAVLAAQAPRRFALPTRGLNRRTHPSRKRSGNRTLNAEPCTRLFLSSFHHFPKVTSGDCTPLITERILAALPSQPDILNL